MSERTAATRRRLPIRERESIAADGTASKARAVFCPEREQSMSVVNCLKCPRCKSVDSVREFVECAPVVPAHAEANAFAARSPFADLGERAARIRLGEILDSNVVTVRGDTTVELMRALMLARELDSVPVVDADGGLIGIVSQSDLLRVDADAEGETATDVMTPCVHALPEDSTLAHALALMAFERLRQVPVVTRDGRVVGLFTALDGIQWVTDQWGYVIFRGNCQRA